MGGLGEVRQESKRVLHASSPLLSTHSPTFEVFLEQFFLCDTRRIIVILGVLLSFVLLIASFR